MQPSFTYDQYFKHTSVQHYGSHRPILYACSHAVWCKTTKSGPMTPCGKVKTLRLEWVPSTMGSWQIFYVRSNRLTNYQIWLATYHHDMGIFKVQLHPPPSGSHRSPLRSADSLARRRVFPIRVQYQIYKRCPSFPVSFCYLSMPFYECLVRNITLWTPVRLVAFWTRLTAKFSNSHNTIAVDYTEATLNGNSGQLRSLILTLGKTVKLQAIRRLCSRSCWTVDELTIVDIT